ncbi:MAG: hypothetical protein IJX87_06290 [Clostridia bacterium]|nr:hypothetical protein [Clostridia bacterium]
MKNESVAILDIRSDEVTFLIGSKGVNGTFVFKGSHSERYEGFSIKEGFHDEDSLRRAISVSVTSVRQNYEGTVDEVYVGVPTGFVSLYTKGHTNSYPSKRKITAQDVDALYESGLNELLAQGKCIRRSHMYFTLGDNRKCFSVNDLYGVPTTLLKGAICYYFVSDAFCDLIDSILMSLSFTKVHLIPSTLAQSQYLMSEKKREGYAFLLDIGFLTTSISVVYGNGIVHEQSFDCGVGKIIAELMVRLDVDFYVAEEILSTTRVYRGVIPEDQMWTSEWANASFRLQDINEIIKSELDVLCEEVERFFNKHYREKNTTGLTVNPLSITGEGISYIKGATEHLSQQLCRLTEIVYPDLPYYDKPMYSARISLLDMALSDATKSGWLHRLFNNIGGKKK